MPGCLHLVFVNSNSIPHSPCSLSHEMKSNGRRNWNTKLVSREMKSSGSWTNLRADCFEY
ncbi:unnamed protein product [Citrullus colocynthis]|uniref:Uncharacterized protein n=1 Tax=Citrullus colocynthis TaxID=252529 RepID=A0ABP0ZER3_9ROSI